MVIYTLKNNKTRKANRPSKNSKNKNISRKTLKNEKNKYNKHKKKNKHNNNPKKYLTSTKKRLTDRNKHNITKKLVGGVTFSDIATGLKFGKVKRSLNRTFSLSSKKAQEFTDNENLHTELRKLLKIEDKNLNIERSIKNFVKDILHYIYYKLNDISILGDPCINNILKITKINDFLENKEKLTNKIGIQEVINKRKQQSDPNIDYLKLIIIDKLKDRFLEFLQKLNSKKNSQKLITTTLNQPTQNKNSDYKDYFKEILLSHRNNLEEHEDTIYYYNEKNEYYLGIICKKKFNNEDTFTDNFNIPIKIEQFNILDKVVNSNVKTNVLFKEIKKADKNKEIREKLLNLFCYYTIFRVIDKDKSFTNMINTIKNPNNQPNSKLYTQKTQKSNPKIQPKNPTQKSNPKSNTKNQTQKQKKKQKKKPQTK